jgi:hypothetical protein
MFGLKSCILKLFLPFCCKYLNKSIRRRRPLFSFVSQYLQSESFRDLEVISVTSQGVSFEEAIQQARIIIEKAEGQRITLRTIGAVAFRIHCPNSTELYSALKRDLTDIDFVAEQKNATKIDKLFADMKWELKFGRLMYYDRKVYEDSSSKLKADVFFDRLRMNHTIDLRNRLGIDDLTISVADLFLEKMQIVEINEKDIKDIIVLLKEHELGNQDKETLNIGYVTKLLAQDWGFYYTVTQNLAKVKSLLGAYSALTEESKSKINSKIDDISSLIEREPKSFGWKMRAKVGEKKKWYTEVGDLNI